MSQELIEVEEETKLPQIVLIQYPATVQNEDKMMKTLGGIRKVSEVRIEMKYNFKNIFNYIFY